MVFSTLSLSLEEESFSWRIPTCILRTSCPSCFTTPMYVMSCQQSYPFLGFYWMQLPVKQSAQLPSYRKTSGTIQCLDHKRWNFNQLSISEIVMQIVREGQITPSFPQICLIIQVRTDHPIFSPN